ncbi:hypothetical protein N1851_005629 [Merluccius polli]|uniref:Uncharacterized protein n=1 Tax=Merluccius polli TaxID=89951 RepID=A0AA47N5K3_MERPO|nr:hypothetical protein N1851_005629 [Merluccius polli]
MSPRNQHVDEASEGNIVLAGALSQAPLPSTGTQVSSISDYVDVHVDMVTSSLPVSDITLQKIVQETEKYMTMQAVISNLRDGLSNGSCPQFYPVRAVLIVVNSLVLRQSRMVIPQSMCQDMLCCVHKGHLCMEKCKRRAKESEVYWPGINMDIESKIKNVVRWLVTTDHCSAADNSGSSQSSTDSITPPVPCTHRLAAKLKREYRSLRDF